MHVLILNWRDIKHPLAGGAEISTHEHAKNIIKHGHTVTQFSSSFSGAKKNEMIDGVNIIRGGNHYTVHMYAIIYYFMYLRRTTVDIVIDQFHFVPFFTPLYIKTKKLAYIHETAEQTWFKNAFFPISTLGFFLEPFFFILYKNISFMTCSDSTRKDLVKFGIPNKNITVIHNGLTQLTSKKKKKANQIIYLGRLAYDKGIEDAIYAVSAIQKKYEDIQFVIVGKEEKKDYTIKLTRLIKKLNITSVTFMGHVTEQEKFNLLKESTILLHPSIKEGWGLTVIEAASQSTPTVAYNTSGLRDSIVHNKTGILVDDITPQSLADTVITLLDNKIFYNTLSKNATIWSKKFSWKDATRDSLALIKKIL